MKKGVLLLGTLLLAACGDESSRQASAFNVETQDALVVKTLPAIRQACPGLDVYSSEFLNVRVQENYRTTIVFDISETAKLPPLFRAYGHSCFVEISPDGKDIFIDKAPCKSVCLNRSQVPDGQLTLPLLGVETHG